MAETPSQLSTPSRRPTLPFRLAWSHYAFLVSVRDPAERAFYEIEAAIEWLVELGWKHVPGPILAPDGDAPERPNYPPSLWEGASSPSSPRRGGGRITTGWPKR